MSNIPVQYRRSEKKKSGLSVVRLLVVVGGFFLTGLALGLLTPYVEHGIPALESYFWTATPCVIESSGVEATGDLEIRYRYESAGQTYVGTQVYFHRDDLTEAEAERLAEAYPAGAEAVCYVDAGSPMRAVLRQGPWWRAAMTGLPIVPIFLYVVVLVRMTRRSRRREFENQWRDQTLAQPAGSSWSPPPPPAFMKPSTASPMPSTQAGSITLGPGRVALKSQTSPGCRLLVMLGACLFWNGVVSAFVVLLISEWRKGDPSIFLAIFLIPFVIVGLLFIYGVLHSFLALFNPRPLVVANRQDIPLGEMLEVGWFMEGRARRVRRLEIYLEGKETATYQRGTTTYNDTNVFAKIPIVDTESVQQGRAGINIPTDIMHTFESDNNKITWSICVRGHIPGWPDVSEDFNLTIKPLAGAHHARSAGASTPDTEHETPMI